MDFFIEQVKEYSDDLLAAFQQLVPQLSKASPPDREALEEIIQAPGSVLLCARQQDTRRVLGVLTLITARIPTGRRAWIEDVVVDGNSRGLGIGEALTRAALDEARRRGISLVELTSRPGREAANRLYQRIGFIQPETNYYRYYLEEEQK